MDASPGSSDTATTTTRSTTFTTCLTPKEATTAARSRGDSYLATEPKAINTATIRKTRLHGEIERCRYDWNMEIKCGDSSGVKKVVIHNKPCDDNTRKSFARDDMAGSGWEYFMHQEDEDNEEWYHRGDPKTGKGKYIYVEMYGE